MSKGSPSLKVRVPVPLLQAVTKAISELNRTRFEEPLTVSSFILGAITSRLKELERHRRYSRSKRTQKNGSGPLSLATVEHTSTVASKTALERQAENEST